MPPPDTDRNLLFAVLALQADCLTQTHFVEACTLWASRKDMPIADLMIERGWMNAGERADVDRLLERKLQKHKGDAKAAFVEATYDNQVRQSIAAIPDDDVRHTLAPSNHGHILLSTTGPSEQDSRDRYTITRLHATGGIGRVWLARDGAIGREVALKELRPERAKNPGIWERFLKEAQITGQLEHPGIVPIYELGRRPENNQPFYTMRFVRGHTLREKIAIYHQKRERRELDPLDLNNLLTAFIGVCNAIAYAHSKGIIHRDLKPANIVLGEFGEVMVLDWGLARELNSTKPEVRDPEHTIDMPSSSSNSTPISSGSKASQTLEGQILGTPAYMAPEQADGRLADLDARTDVYGLGAVLYEILAGRPPFTGHDTDDLLSRVRTLAPDRPRDVVPGTPRALEAICLKALQKKSADRYQTAEAFAQDVRRFLADEPTTAYQEPFSIRAGRWAKRNRTKVISAVAVLAVAVPILLTAVVLLNQSEQRERNAREKEEVARVHAQTNYQRSLVAADALSEELARGIRPIAGTQAKTVVGILDRVRQISDDLLSDPDATPEALERRARLLILFAELYRDTNKTNSAKRASEQALEIYDRLLAANPDDRNLHIGRGRARHRLGWTLYDQCHDDEAIVNFKAAIAELEAVGAENDPLVAAIVIASSYTLMANIETDFGNLDVAEAAYQRGLALRRKAKIDSHGDTDVRTQLAVSLERYGLFKEQYRKKENSHELLLESAHELEEVCRENPWNAALHVHLLRVYTSMIQIDHDDVETAGLIKATQVIVDRFAQRDPDHLIWIREGIRLKHYQIRQRMKGYLFLEPKVQYDLHIEQLNVTHGLFTTTRDLNSLDPDNYLWLADVANFESRVAEMHIGMVRAEPLYIFHHAKEAREHALDAMRIYACILERSPRSIEMERGYIFSMSQLAKSELDPTAILAARFEYAAREIALYHRLSTEHPTDTHWMGQTSFAYFRAGGTLRYALMGPIWKYDSGTGLSAVKWVAPYIARMEPQWERLARPEVMTPLIRLAGLLAEPPAAMSPDVSKNANSLRSNAAILLRGLDARGALPPEGKAVLAKLPAEEK